MNRQTTRARLEAIEKTMNARPSLPCCVCQMTDGKRKEFQGFTVLQPFLDGEITSISCDDTDMAHMLREMDTEKTISIEVTWKDGYSVYRENI